MATAKQVACVVRERFSRHDGPFQASLVGMVVAGLTVAGITLGASQQVAADASTRHNLNPGVRPGDIVIMREVEPTPIRSVDRHAGPIRSRVNPRDSAMGVPERLNTVGIVPLSDNRAAGVSSGALGHQGQVITSTNSLAHRVVEGMGAGTSRVAGAQGGGSAAGGIAGRVTSATSGIAGNVTRALSPLTGRN